MPRTHRLPLPCHPGVLHRVLTCIAILLLTALAGPPSVAAQVLYGSLVGNITDDTGGALPGATVTITQTETGASHEAVTDNAGAYRFSTVQPGTYTITVKLTGFRTFTRERVPVTLNSVTRVDAPLQVGQLSENVTVAAESPVLQTDRAEVRSELKSTELENLPVSMNRNINIYSGCFRDSRRPPKRTRFRPTRRARSCST